MDKFEKRLVEFKKICEDLAKLFYKKNKDYGDSYFSKEQEGYPVDKILSKVDFYVQIKRKFSRLAAFAEKRLNGENSENLVADETEKDTVQDIMIYCVMFLIKEDLNG